MTLHLPKHLLSFSRQLFLSVIALFVAFVICFIAFQYRREKDYNVELLNIQLQNYNLCKDTSLGRLARYSHKQGRKGYIR